MTDGQFPTLLDELLRRRMWTYARFAREYRKAAERLGVPGQPPEERQVKRWRAGRVERPRSAACEVLEEIFGRTVPELLAAPERGVPVAEEVQPLRRSALRLLGGSAVVPLLEPMSLGQAAAEALSWSRELERTDVGPGTLAHLEAAVERLCGGYAELPAEDAWQVALMYRRQVAALLSGRHTIREGRELARCAGLLSVVLAWLAHDLGQAAVADAYCLDARLHGEHAELPEVCAWAEDCRATVALYAERPEAALAAAVRGRACAPAGTAAEVRLVGQVARACARAGREEEFRAALGEARAFQERLPVHAGGLLSADAARIASFEASGQRMLGRAGRGRLAAETAVSLYRSAAPGRGGGHRSPTRLAVALLDLAGVRGAEGDLEGAVAAGREALGVGRAAEAINVRAAQVASALLGVYGGASAARDFAGVVRAVATSGR